MGAVVLLWARPPGDGVARVGRRGGERRRHSGGVRTPRTLQRGGTVRALHRRARARGRGVIDVAFTPAGLRPAGVAVVIDVLRATSTAAQALASGYRSVACADSLARARLLRGPGRTLAGEHECLKPPGFDLGNSPAGVLHPGESCELVLATTNGAPAIVAAAEVAGEVLLACLLNLDAVAAALDGEEVASL